jgi:hypothetical protein
LSRNPPAGILEKQNRLQLSQLFSCPHLKESTGFGFSKIPGAGKGWLITADNQYLAAAHAAVALLTYGPKNP